MASDMLAIAASAVSDVASVVATELDYVQVLTAAGLDLETAARQITFSMALGCRFYLAIAKIRAARKLWADVFEACGGSADAQRMCLRVSTGRRVLTTRNQLLNILRNTVACYAGAVADADVITTTPFDAPTGLPTEASRRNARNTQHILAEECHLAQVVDSAGGSCYIEWYSDEVHIMGRQMANGIGGSGDFARNAFISIFTSRQKGSKISAIAQMVSHMDHSMHSVQVLGDPAWCRRPAWQDPIRAGAHHSRALLRAGIPRSAQGLLSLRSHRSCRSARACDPPQV